MSAQGVPFARGYKLGRYEVIGRISVGGMAELYLAFLTGQGGFRKFVALKRVLPSVMQQESFSTMFLDEARITASLSHANIAQVFELVETPEDGEPVLAMEFVAGQNLRQIIKRAQARDVELPPAFSCRVMCEVLLGLHSAHHCVDPSGNPMEVIHRDINPRNIMVTFNGGTKIIDFGVAKARGRLDTTRLGVVKGTVQYMSPEQVQLRELDGRSDLFAASVVLYELLAKRRPFDEPTDAAAAHSIAHGTVPPLRELVPSLPEPLIEVVMKGLSKKPGDRWKSGSEYRRALEVACPASFDDQQVAALMGRLFEDKIALTRALLQSTSLEATDENLKFMEEADLVDAATAIAAQPGLDVTVPVPQLERVETTRPSVEPSARDATVLMKQLGTSGLTPTRPLDGLGPFEIPAFDEVPTVPDRPRFNPEPSRAVEATSEGRTTRANESWRDAAESPEGVPSGPERSRGRSAQERRGARGRAFPQRERRGAVPEGHPRRQPASQKPSES
jgi:serine/threonine-protein kinase